MQQISCNDMFAEFMRRDAVDPKRSTVSVGCLELCLGRRNRKGRFSSRYGLVVLRGPTATGSWTFTFRARGRDWALLATLGIAIALRNPAIAWFVCCVLLFAAIDYSASYRQVREVVFCLTGKLPNFVLK